jgi:hypothetical protein
MLCTRCGVTLDDKDRFGSQCGQPTPPGVISERPPGWAFYSGNHLVVKCLLWAYPKRPDPLCSHL